MAGSARLAVKVIPGASRDAVVGWLGDALKVRVHSPPEKGKANAAVCELLATLLAVPVRDISVASGHASRNKAVEVRGLTVEEVRRRIDSRR